MIPLTYDNVDAQVRKYQRRGIDVRWSGWDLVFFKVDNSPGSRRALHSTNGRLRNGEWGFETVITPNEAGNWLVDYRLVRSKGATRR